MLSVALLASFGGGMQLRAQEKLASTGEMPILAWHGIPAEETTVERFRELKEAGFTHNFSFYRTAEQVAKALDVAQKTGIKQIITCGELLSEPEKTVARFKKHPAISFATSRCAAISPRWANGPSGYGRWMTIISVT